METNQLINPLLRRERLDTQRFHPHRLVIELVAFAAVKRVLEPVAVVALGIIEP